MSVAHSVEDKLRTDDIHIEEAIDFAGLMLSQAVLKGLMKAGFRKPSPIQLKAIPLGRCGLDLIVQAKSGTGKTCVFSVIALEGIDVAFNSAQVLILAPTREIAIQITNVIQTLGLCLHGLIIHSFIGGTSVLEDKIRAKHCHIAVGTPGRIKQLIEIGALKTGCLRLFVLDEADKLLNGDFIEAINWIYSVLPHNKQVLALSATYPENLANHITKYMRNPTFIRLNISDPALIGIKQYQYIVPNHPLPNKVFEYKTEAILTILSCVDFHQCLIFSNLQYRAQHLQAELEARNWPTVCIAGFLDQKDRNFAMEQLKTYQCRILISTDLTSRGIDADKVNLIINLDVPKDHETYLHRIGRAGRFGSYGAAISIVSEGVEDKELRAVAKACKILIPKIPHPIPKDLSVRVVAVKLSDVVSTETIVNHQEGNKMLPHSSLPEFLAIESFSERTDCEEEPFFQSFRNITTRPHGITTRPHGASHYGTHSELNTLPPQDENIDKCISGTTNNSCTFSAKPTFSNGNENHEKNYGLTALQTQTSTFETNSSSMKDLCLRELGKMNSSNPETKASANKIESYDGVFVFSETEQDVFFAKNKKNDYDESGLTNPISDECILSDKSILSIPNDTSILVSQDISHKFISGFIDDKCQPPKLNDNRGVNKNMSVNETEKDTNFQTICSQPNKSGIHDFTKLHFFPAGLDEVNEIVSQKQKHCLEMYGQEPIYNSDCLFSHPERNNLLNRPGENVEIALKEINVNCVSEVGSLIKNTGTILKSICTCTSVDTLVYPPELTYRNRSIHAIQESFCDCLSAASELKTICEVNLMNKIGLFVQSLSFDDIRNSKCFSENEFSLLFILKKKFTDCFEKAEQERKKCQTLVKDFTKMELINNKEILKERNPTAKMNIKGDHALQTTDNLCHVEGIYSSKNGSEQQLQYSADSKGIDCCNGTLKECIKIYSEASKLDKISEDERSLNKMDQSLKLNSRLFQKNKRPQLENDEKVCKVNLMDDIEEDEISQETDIIRKHQYDMRDSECILLDQRHQDMLEKRKNGKIVVADKQSRINTITSNSENINKLKTAITTSLDISEPSKAQRIAKSNLSSVTDASTMPVVTHKSLHNCKRKNHNHGRTRYYETPNINDMPMVKKASNSFPIKSKTSRLATHKENTFVSERKMPEVIEKAWDERSDLFSENIVSELPGTHSSMENPQTAHFVHRDSRLGKLVKAVGKSVKPAKLQARMAGLEKPNDANESVIFMSGYGSEDIWNVADHQTASYLSSEKCKCKSQLSGFNFVKNNEGNKYKHALCPNQTSFSASGNKIHHKRKNVGHSSRGLQNGRHSHNFEFQCKKQIEGKTLRHKQYQRPSCIHKPNLSVVSLQSFPFGPFFLNSPFTSLHSAYVTYFTLHFQQPVYMPVTSYQLQNFQSHTKQTQSYFSPYLPKQEHVVSSYDFQDSQYITYMTSTLIQLRKKYQV